MLHTYQEITLLALKDDKGTVSIQNLAQILAGAFVAELILRKKLSVSEDKKRMIDVIDSTPTGDALLDECITKITHAKRRARLQTWVGRFAMIKNVHHKAAQSLCDLGILKKTSDKVLFIFNRTIYPEINPQPERETLARLEKAIFTHKKDLCTEDVLLVSLADASMMLDRIFGRTRLKPLRKRITQIVEGEAAGEGTREAIAAIQAATILTVVILPIVINS